MYRFRLLFFHHFSESEIYQRFFRFEKLDNRLNVTKNCQTTSFLS
ncbi:hypothetical protein NT05LM_0154 [Listeria marthii FSL S4-120]|uniref:Uncharacterized protein n=1 Tax=Listeria marthii FSL S4-120 TaxID=702457 RepID=A0ABP2K236_9LIST|nr:hypothetical protein NT05LM_0154 [Listeria marthii FSL S4-120]